MSTTGRFAVVCRRPGHPDGLLVPDIAAPYWEASARPTGPLVQSVARWAGRGEGGG